MTTPLVPLLAGTGYEGPNPLGVYSNPVGHWILIAVGVILLLFVVLTVVANTVWYERVSLGRLQLRPGPNRVGPHGLLQIPADTVKMITKESFAPYGVDTTLYLLAPGLIVTASLLAWAVIPVGIWYGWTYWMANLNVGVLFVFGVAAMNVYAILLAGWSSNNKYSMLGGLRAAAQLVSYEMAMGLSLVPVFMIAHSVTLQSIATYSVHWGPYRGPVPFIVLAPLSFVIFVMSQISEINRAPFDLPEAEQELIGGYLTEYSGLKFLCFYIGEYINLVTASTLITVIFLGAWFPTFTWFPAFIPFVIKVLAVLFFMFWLRSTFPRLRYDMLMRLGWKILLPLALLNVVVTAIILVAVGG